MHDLVHPLLRSRQLLFQLANLIEYRRQIHGCRWRGGYLDAADRISQLLEMILRRGCFELLGHLTHRRQDLVGPVIAVRPFTHTDHYWQVYFDTNEAIVRVAREAGWPPPTPAQITRGEQT